MEILLPIFEWAAKITKWSKEDEVFSEDVRSSVLKRSKTKRKTTKGNISTPGTYNWSLRIWHQWQVS